MSRHDALLIFGLALFVRGWVFFSGLDTATWDWHLWDQTDSFTYLETARQIAAGDWWAHQPFQPMHGWHLAIGTAEQWREWNGPHSFYQTPAYAYVLALLGGLGIPVIRGLQLLVGAAHCVLVGALGNEVAGRWAGLGAGGLAATNGLFVVNEMMVLREGPGMLIATLAMLLAVKGIRNGDTRIWMVVGVTLGLGVLFKETSMVLTAAIGTALIPVCFGRRGVGPLVALFVGFQLALAPLYVRNLVVGAPARELTSSYKVANALAQANIRGAPFGGAYGFSDGYVPAVRQAQGSSDALRQAIAESWRGHEAELVGVVAKRMIAVFSDAELPDNFSHRFVALEIPVVSVLPTFRPVLWLAVLGLLLSLRRGFQGDRRLMLLLLYAVAAHVAAQLLGNVIGRYRVVMVPFLMVPAGLVLHHGVALFQYKRWQGVGLLALAGLLVVGSPLLPRHPELAQAEIRWVDFRTGARLLLERGDPARAHALYNQARMTLSPEDTNPLDIDVHELELMLFHGYREPMRGLFEQRFAEFPEHPVLLRMAPFFQSQGSGL